MTIPTQVGQNLGYYGAFLNTSNIKPMNYDELEECRERLMLQGDYCSCGTPDPLDHTDTCTVYLDIFALLEVEKLLGVCMGEMADYILDHMFDREYEDCYDDDSEIGRVGYDYVSSKALQHRKDCTGKLVERTNSHTGQKFWGCEHFPNCTYSRAM